jgi:hypothetical protein
MRFQRIALGLAILTTNGCGLFQQAPQEVKIVTKPIKIAIVQPTLPRPLSLKEPRWYVVSDTKITNPCIKNEETKKRDCTLGTENQYPKGYTYLDKFLDDIKKTHGGDIVFTAMSVADYQLMSYNIQELTRYVNQLGEVVVYYKEVTAVEEE